MQHAWPGALNEPQSVIAVVEELLARDQIILDGVDANFFKRDPFSGCFGGDVEREINDKLIGVGAVVKRPCDSLAATRRRFREQFDPILTTGPDIASGCGRGTRRGHSWQGRFKSLPIQEDESIRLDRIVKDGESSRPQRLT